MLVKFNVVATKILALVLSFTMVAVAPVASTSPLANQGCQSRCGSFNLSYPFGIGSADCFYNEWFEILCRNDKPGLRINQDGAEVNEVLQIDSLNEFGRYTLTIRSNTSNMRVCEDTSKLLGPNLTGTNFYYSGRNKFMLFGSGTAIWSGSTIGSTGTTRGGCTSVSDGRSLGTGIDSCYGLNCCQASSIAASEFKLSYSNSVTGNNTCAYAFMVADGWYPQNASLFSDHSADLAGVSVPVLIEWHFPKSISGHGFQDNSYCKLDPSNEYWYCECPCGLKGNPYIVDGCQDHLFDCSGPFVRKNLKFIIVGGILLLLFVLTGTSYLLYKAIRRRINKKIKEKRFKRNGGALLQKHLSSNINIMEKVRLFSGKDLNKATDYFNENRVIGRGGQGTVYKGMLHDGKIVAIKKSKLLVNVGQVEEFINEIIILSQIDHRNVVKLFGCCLEMDVPLLVYEFIPNGTLFNLIHSENSEFSLSWEVRLRISLEVAEALAYLHSATTRPVYHRDIKSSNILLDEKYKAKVADFGTSRHIRVDQTHLTTMVKGTFGYLDPEYFQSSQFTEKSDVYSFGVVLVELLTGLKPICFSEEEQSHLNLATLFLLAMEENSVDMILDPQVKETSSDEEREAIIRLSQRCLNVNGRNRPSMKEIAMELQSIKKSEIPSTVEENSYGKGNKKQKDVNHSGNVTSIHLMTSSSSDVSSLLSST